MPYFKSASKRIIIVSLLFFTLFAVFTLIIKLDLFVQNDFNLLVKIQDKLPQKVYGVFSFIVVLGSFIPSTLLLFFLMRFQNRWQNLVIVALYVAMHSIEIVGKLFLDHKGPPYRFFKQNPTLSFPLEYSVSDSYPSGHVLRSFFIATLAASAVFKKTTIAYKYKFCATVLFYIVATAISFGKIGLGHHWVSDTIGGFFLGIACGLAAIAKISYRRLK